MATEVVLTEKGKAKVGTDTIGRLYGGSREDVKAEVLSSGHLKVTATSDYGDRLERTYVLEPDEYKKVSKQ